MAEAIEQKMQEFKAKFEAC